MLEEFDNLEADPNEQRLLEMVVCDPFQGKISVLCQK